MSEHLFGFVVFTLPGPRTLLATAVLVAGLLDGAA